MNPLAIIGVLSMLAAGVVILLGSASAEAATSGKHEVTSQGWVTVDPRILSKSAGVSDNTYALASMMQSEAGDSERVQIATGWCARNRADEKGISVFRLLTRAGSYDKASKQFIPHESDGFYGPQNVGPRYATTRKAPTVPTLERAAAILSGEVDDPTEGCTQFDAPGAQDTLLGKIAGYTKSAAQVAEERAKGSELVMLPGISSTRFWRPKDA